MECKCGFKTIEQREWSKHIYVCEFIKKEAEAFSKKIILDFNNWLPIKELNKLSTIG